ncbi:hypothetical protein Srubr_52880 [Streptomyces rubradiris]|uniref:Uncharacterized protein n=1 Tax=Streptomyces rubradiris TaxID=285531 RepID=A0ABQ3RI31_STRRR|nr:hypothetical protein GCM10018792_73460 [Streptomyces rubradiris]GHI55442.1 hypothetical protein Srubr_52880 [Streptomyces rubradiris]
MAAGAAGLAGLQPPHPQGSALRPVGKPSETREGTAETERERSENREGTAETEKERPENREGAL